MLISALSGSWLTFHPRQQPFQARSGGHHQIKNERHRAQWLANLLLDPAAPGSISSIPKKISVEIFFDVAEVNQRLCLEKVDSGLKMLIEPIWL